MDKSRTGDTLEARFNAFKIPESNFLVFEATVRTCRDGCQPAYCPAPSGRQEPSFGKRRRRSLHNGKLNLEKELTIMDNSTENNTKLTSEVQRIDEMLNTNTTINELASSNGEFCSMKLL